jgi:ankyrin repeat protein
MLRMIKSQYSVLMVLLSLSLFVGASEVREQPCIDMYAAPDCEGNTPLHKACSAGNIELVRALLTYGSCVNSTNKFGDTPLHRAIENKHVDVALELLTRDDINVNCYNQYGDTPLHRATFHGLIPVIERLIEKGADINARGSSGDTPLHITVENEYFDVFTKLLSYAGVDVNIANGYGDTPLHRAAYLHRRYKCIPLLLAHGARVNSVNSLNRTPLFCAVLNGMEKSVKLLSRVADIDPNIAGIDRKSVV